MQEYGGAASARLVNLAAEGDEQAFARLVFCCRGTLFAAARAILRSDQDAQDCVQEAVFRGWQKLSTLREPQYFKTWLTRIVISTAINQSKKRRPTLPLPEALPGKRVHTDERLDIRRAIEALDEKTRVVTVLYYFEDMPVEEIAKAVGTLPGTVKSRLFRARERLRDVLEGYDHDAE